MALVSRRAAAALLLCGAAAFAHAADAPRVKFHTSMGDIVVEVYPDKAPKTAENFLTYVREKRYDGTIFHRVINGFMIQGGGYSKDLWEKPTRPPIPLEVRKDLPNARGTISMARTQDPNSATGQFFINVVDNGTRLGPREGSAGYAVFGKVVSGMDVVDKIKAVKTGPKGEHANVPLQPIVIESATLVK